jgi:hypothetical protein
MQREKEIKVSVGDIFNYTIGRNYKHPIDAVLDLEEEDRFECHQTFIYDATLNSKKVQSLEYLHFFIELDKCRHNLSIRSNPRRSEVLRLSEELWEISPKKIFLPTHHKSEFEEGSSSKKLKEIFGLNNFNELKFADFKLSEEEALKKTYREQQLEIYKGLL